MPRWWRRCRCGGAGSRCGGAGSRCGGAGCRCGGAGSRCGGAGSRCGGAGSRCGGADSRCGGAVPDAVAPVPDAVAPVPDAVAPVPDAVAPVPDAVAPVPDVVAPVPDLVAPASDVIAFLQDMLTAGASAVVPLTQLQSDLFSWFSSLFGIAGMQPVVVGLGGAVGAGLSAAADGSVASQLPLVRALAGIPGVPLAGNATGVATPEGIAASTFGATTQIGRGSPLPGMAPLAPTWRHSDGCAAILPGCLRTPASRFTVGAGRCRSARRRRACDSYSNRGARRIPPGQSRFRIAGSGHRALRPSGAVRCRPFGVIGCRPFEASARHPSGGGKRRVSSR